MFGLITTDIRTVVIDTHASVMIVVDHTIEIKKF